MLPASPWLRWYVSLPCWINSVTEAALRWDRQNFLHVHSPSQGCVHTHTSLTLRAAAWVQCRFTQECKTGPSEDVLTLKQAEKRQRKIASPLPMLIPARYPVRIWISADSHPAVNIVWIDMIKLHQRKSKTKSLVSLAVSWGPVLGNRNWFPPP